MTIADCIYPGCEETPRFLVQRNDGGWRAICARDLYPWFDADTTPMAKTIIPLSGAPS